MSQQLKCQFLTPTLSNLISNIWWLVESSSSSKHLSNSNTATKLYLDVYVRSIAILISLVLINLCCLFGMPLFFPLDCSPTSKLLTQRWCEKRSQTWLKLSDHSPRLGLLKPVHSPLLTSCLHDRNPVIWSDDSNFPFSATVFMMKKKSQFLYIFSELSRPHCVV